MVDVERYEFPSTSREYTELAGRGCSSICATAATGDLTAAFAAIVAISAVVGFFARCFFYVSKSSPSDLTMPDTSLFEPIDQVVHVSPADQRLEVGGRHAEGSVVLSRAVLHRWRNDWFVLLGFCWAIDHLALRG
jgi:hypothetical protein